MKKVKDHFYKKAKEEGYAARSVYKLQELDRKYSLILKGDTVLDLGCSPGSWLQYVSRKVGGGGKVIGIDMQTPGVSLAKNATFIKEDVFGTQAGKLARDFGGFDVVLSDMAPKTTGVKFADQMASLELARRAAEIALGALKNGGHFVCKVFESGEISAFRKELKTHFLSIHSNKPKASRGESFEIFIVGMSRKGDS